MTAPTHDLRMSIDRWQEAFRDPHRAVDRLESHIARFEPRIRALVSEPGRFGRLRRDLEACGNGELAAIPIGVKDIFHVDGLPTGAGSKLPSDALTGSEAVCVSALKQAGGIVLGKTVSTEFAYFVPGPTRNPCNPEHTPGGSSSGSAAAVAAGYCPVALGTQTIGSICRPASFCGVVGFKPSYGRVSTAGVIPLSPSLDHVGIFTVTVSDAIRTAAALSDRWDPPTVDRTPVLGVPVGPYLDRVSDEGAAHFRQICGALKSAGWPVRPCEIFTAFDQIEARHHLIVAAEAARVHRTWFERFGELYHPRTRELIGRGAAISDRELADNLAQIDGLRTRIVQHMSEAEIDLWISPAATGSAPRGLETTGDPVMNLPWTQAGMPAISLPAGTDSGGMPMGLQVVSRFGADEYLLLAASELETALRHRP